MASKIRFIRRVKGVSEIARNSGYSSTHISAVLRGERRSRACVSKLVALGYELPQYLLSQLVK